MSNIDARKEKEQLDKCSGEILRAAVSVETFLDIFISNYFCRGNRIFVFQNIIVGEKMNLFKKIDIIRGIFNYEQEVRNFQDVTPLDSEKIKEIIDALEEIRKTRNLVAHGNAVFDGQSMYLEKNRAYTTEKDRRRLTPQYVKDFRQLVGKALSGIDKMGALLKTD